MTTKKTRTSFEIKSTHLALITFVLKSNDIDTIAHELAEQFSKQPNYFDDEPIVIDLSKVAAQDLAVDFAKLVQVMRNRHMMPFAVSNGTTEQLAAARVAELLVAPETLAAPAPQAKPNKAANGTENQAETKANSKINPATGAPQALAKTMLIDKPLRSGQQIYARNADLVITSMVSFGAEAIADGNIHVYAPLRGRVIAGAQGNTEARIFTTCFEPQLFSIAGVFQTTDKPLPSEILGKAAMVYLENDSLIMAPLQVSNT